MSQSIFLPYAPTGVCCWQLLNAVVQWLCFPDFMDLTSTDQNSEDPCNKQFIGLPAKHRLQKSQSENQPESKSGFQNHSTQSFKSVQKKLSFSMKSS